MHARSHHRLLTALALVGVSTSATAYTLYTNERGDALHWKAEHLVVHASTTKPSLTLSADAVDGALATSFGTWVATDCVPEVTVGARTASFDIAQPGHAVATGENIVVFIPTSEAWSALGRGSLELAITVIQTNTRTGAIIDADIAVNEGDFTFTLDPSPAPGEADLIATLTHEAGHFFGLDHSAVDEATMSSFYDPADPAAKRTLAQDDVDGVCALDVLPFPKEPEPSCAAGGGLGWVSLGALWLLTLRRRSAYACRP